MSMDSMLRTTAVLTGWVFSAAAVSLSMGGALGAYSLANLFLASLAFSVFISVAAIVAPYLPKPSGFIIHTRPARPMSSYSLRNNEGSTPFVFEKKAQHTVGTEKVKGSVPFLNSNHGIFLSWGNMEEGLGTKNTPGSISQRASCIKKV